MVSPRDTGADGLTFKTKPGRSSAGFNSEILLNIRARGNSTGTEPVIRSHPRAPTITATGPAVMAGSWAESKPTRSPYPRSPSPDNSDFQSFRPPAFLLEPGEPGLFLCPPARPLKRRLRRRGLSGYLSPTRGPPSVFPYFMRVSGEFQGGPPGDLRPH